MRDRVFFQTLLAIRAIVDAALAHFEEPAATPSTGSAVACDHPSDRRRDTSTLDAEEWVCRDCAFHFHELR
jgi:hypothetical protein